LKKLVSECFTSEAIDYLRSEILSNRGQEVSFVGNVDHDGKIYEAQAMAYGNDNSAPVILMETLQGDVLIHNHPGEDPDGDLLRASESDIQLAAELANKKIGFYIVDNSLDFVNVIFKPESRVYLKNDDVMNIFEEGGILSECISNFESREEQIQLVKNVIEAVNESRILVSEAGTGTGKSLSYLIPAAVWALENKKRVIISTHTINLQQQIAGKDMLIVEKVIKAYLKKNINYAVLIGKGNYLCKKKLYGLIKDKEKQDSLFEEKERLRIIFDIGEWCKRCEEGTISEFGEYVNEEVWEEVACDSNSCPRRKCEYYIDCFYYRARLQAEKSNIIIANHSLVFSAIDEMSRRIMLPFFSGIVFDEAHHLEDVSIKTLSKDFSVQSLLYLLRKLHGEKKGRDFGLFALLKKRGNIDSYAENFLAFEEMIKMHKELTRLISEFLFDMKSLLGRWAKETNSIGIDDEFINNPDFLILSNALEGIFKKINQFTVHFEGLAERLKANSVTRDMLEIIQTIGYRMSGLSESRNIYDLIFNTENEINFVKWIEITKKNIHFYYSPLEVGDFLANSIFSKKDFSIFTSATLMINKKFDYFTEGVGLQLALNKGRDEVRLHSPFDYSRQAEIYILEDDLDHGNVTEEKTLLVKELSMMSEGGVLALFTSYTRLNQMYEILRDELVGEGLYPLKQGEAPRGELLSRMSKHANVVLFATSSFWEGIDIQGDNLRCVIIEKLPFDSPADPIYKAKVKLMEYKEINPFISYSLPRAVLRLKQGMGRLIRSKSDKGVIAILDNRIKTKKYGSVFLDSLPPAKIISGGLNSILREAESFFSSRF